MAPFSVGCSAACSNSNASDPPRSTTFAVRFKRSSPLGAHLGASVLRPRVLVVARIDRPLLAEGLGLHRDAMGRLRQVVFHGVGAPAAQGDVVLGGAALVAVA